MIYDLTVIIPVYNMERCYLIVLDSLLEQYKLEDCSLRIICVNDGSSDNSQKLLKDYSKRFPFRACKSKKNGGVSSARNAGLDVVRDSEYVTFVDPDDTVKT